MNQHLRIIFNVTNVVLNVLTNHHMTGTELVKYGEVSVFQNISSDSYEAT